MNGLVAIANARGVPGTASAEARDGRGRRCLLANHHVVFGDGAGEGDRVWAIPPDNGSPVCLGHAAAGQLGRVTFAGETVFVDCALVALADEAAFPSWLRGQLPDGWPSTVAVVDPGTRVAKRGAVTGRTEGVVVDVAYPDYPFICGRSWIAPGQLLIESAVPEWNFSAPGDSGAALFDDRGRVVGLLWGSNASGQGVACPIGPVLDCLGAALVEVGDPNRRFA